MKDISKQREFAEKELQKLAEQKAAQVEPAYTPKEIVTVEADLKDFSLTDNGAYLSISHKALHDATIGTVAKSEYEKGDKEALLTSVLQNKFAEFENTHSLRIVGNFVEPKIEKKADDVERGCEYCGKSSVPVTSFSGYVSDSGPKSHGYACEKCKEKFEKFNKKAEIEPAKEITSDLPLMRSADTFQQSIDAAAAREQETFNRFITSTLNDLVSYVKSLHYDEPRVVEAVDSSNLTLNDTGINGHIVVATSLLDNTGPRLLNIGIPITASKPVFPNVNEMQELVSKSIDVNAKIMEEYSKEILANIDKVDATNDYYNTEVESIINEKEATLEKTASDYTDGVATVQPGAHIKLQKHLLPGELDSWEIGDTIYSDGQKWKLVSKGDGVDSNDKNANSASLWDFVQCLPEEADKETKADIPR